MAPSTRVTQSRHSTLQPPIYAYIHCRCRLITTYICTASISQGWVAMGSASRPSLLCFFFLLIWGSCEGKDESMLPPRGWNSYDAFSWTIDEAAFLHNAQIMADKLLPHGYRYAVIDFLWYRQNVNGSGKDAYGFDSIDQWGRPFPDPDRFPSSRGGKGFKHVADKVHGLGLKFGIHLMNGISKQAVNASTSILDIHTGKAYSEDGREWTARDIGLRQRTCAWMTGGFMSVNTELGAGLKVDCIFGTDYSPKEIIAVSEILKELERPIVLSISPGTEVTPALAQNITQHVDMYRITGDDWDSWKDVRPHFDVARSFAVANKIGATGLQGRSWPDLDMLPFGKLTDAGVNQGPHRRTNLTFEEQRTQFGYILSERSLKPDKSAASPSKSSSPVVNPINNGSMLLGLTTCGDDRARGWDEVTLSNEEDQTKLRLAGFGTDGGCLDASASESKTPMFSDCERHSKQVWDLTEKGELVSNYSGLCATVESASNEAAEGTSNGALAWIATGDKGEIYLAFFNLDTTSRQISTRVSDLEKFAGRMLARKTSCSCTQVFSGKSRSLMKGDISAVVSSHGSMLFEIQC
ncbi:hypothetical protein BRADI_2g13520v3 [Brachypodium distachyon]|uniref:Melibiase A n=1 Tax=Brachypodium distachyon TaxID=15368 RepID=A0A0Q3QSH1_BRADI|nr:hypothetical protein BRADI_2g13520v3 [Brachypodium distachyon]